MSCVYEHVYENGMAPCAPARPPPQISDRPGRRYHRYREGKYVIPNDEVSLGRGPARAKTDGCGQTELDRLDLVHHICLLQLDGRLTAAPIVEPEYILDVGTGTGIWAIEMAEYAPRPGRARCCGR